jgi:hypothetical protein
MLWVFIGLRRELRSCRCPMARPGRCEGNRGCQASRGRLTPKEQYSFLLHGFFDEMAALKAEGSGPARGRRERKLFDFIKKIASLLRIRHSSATHQCLRVFYATPSRNRTNGPGLGQFPIACLNSSVNVLMRRRGEPQVDLSGVFGKWKDRRFGGLKGTFQGALHPAEMEPSQGQTFGGSK